MKFEYFPKAGLIVLCLLFFAASTHAHRGDQLLPLQHAVAQWANAYQGDNYEDMQALLSADFVNPQAYLARMRLIPVKRVILRYANYRIHGGHDKGYRATVSSIVHVPYRELNVPYSLTMELVQEGEDWKILTMTEFDEVPAELATDNHPLQKITQDVAIKLRDEDTGKPVHARVHIRDAGGDYWPPRGHRKQIAEGWREDIGGDVVVAGKTFAYVEPDFIAPLPVGEYVMEVRRGLEYEPVDVRFEVRSGKKLSLQVDLNRWIHMAEEGWYSGDTHTHFLDPQTAMLEARGEDLNVINVLISSGGNLITQVPHFTGGPSVFSDENHIAYIGEETRHDYLGHTVLLNLKELIYPFGWGGPHTGVHNAYDYPTMAQQADKAHEQGALVAWSHFPHPHGELPIDVALNKVDAVETMVFGDPLEKHPVRVRMGEFTPEAISPMELWYSLLNTGFDMPGLGSTDKMWNSQVSGSVRTYVDVQGEFNYNNWVQGIDAGRTFFTSGPMLFFSLDDHGAGDRLKLAKPGKKPFEALVVSHLPIDRIEILVNGEVVATKLNRDKEKSLRFSGELMLDDSSWVAARAYSAQQLPTQAHLTGGGSPVMAHTSPVYVDYKKRPRTSAKSARYLLDIIERTIAWAEKKARYHNEQQRQEVLDLYRSAKQVYEKQLSN
jgi:hypothetical protein